MLLPHDTTIVVTDGQKLRLFRNTGTEFHMALTEMPSPGVHGDVEGAARHEHTGGDNKDQLRQQHRSTVKDHQEASFESAVAKWLNHEIASGRLGALLVIAPPRALGELRLHYSEGLKKKLVGELAKEHTRDTVQVLEQVLKDS
jgi:protein required for attachment to host cells